MKVYILNVETSNPFPNPATNMGTFSPECDQTSRYLRDSPLESQNHQTLKENLYKDTGEPKNTNILRRTRSYFSLAITATQ